MGENHCSNNKPMLDSIKYFQSRNKIVSILIGIIMSAGGIALAYFTDNVEPWGTIGGFVCAIGLFLTAHSSISKNGEKLKI